MPETSDRVIAFARDAFETNLSGLLDDPHDVVDDFPAYVRELRVLAADLDLDFDGLVDKLGSPYEIKRFRDIETGVIVLRNPRA